MTARPAVQPSRTVRILAVQALAGATALAIAVTCWAAPADASGPSPGAGAGGSSITSLQTQAEELAGQINADNQALDQLDASYDADQITYSQLQKKQAGLRRQITASAAAVAAARQALRQQAIIDYMAGGAPIITEIPDRPGLDPSLTVAYAAIIAGTQKRTEDDYAATLETQAAEESALGATTKEAALALSDVKADESQATATLAAENQALAQVKGQLAVEVTAVQAQQQAAEQAQEEQNLAAQGDLAPSSTSATDPAGANPGGADPAGAAPDTTAGPATTQAPAATAPAPTPAPAPAPTQANPAPTTAAPTTAPTTTPPAAQGSDPAQAPGVDSVLAYARAQLGKPYQWAGAGPNSFDCSGLVMMAWEQAGIDFPHLAQDQYDMTARIPLTDLIPGDLVFYGTPNDVYHVGIYVGNGDMIDAPETGQDVSVQSIYWTDLLGAGRVTTSS